MPYIVAVHMKQATTLLLLILPFVLVDTLKLKMIPLMFCIALIYMGQLDESQACVELMIRQESRASLRR